MTDGKRVALVTGASRGLGAAVSIELARRGCHVVLTGRTQGGLEETDDAIRAEGGSSTLLPLDLADGQSLDAIGPSIHARFGRLDVLVHNAGALGKLTPTPHILAEDWEAAMTANLTAAWRLIRTSAALLQAAPDGRAVFVTSARARAPKAYWGAYGATKAGLEHLVLTWADETRQTRLRINLFDPGPVASRMRAEAFPGEDPRTIAKPSDIAPRLAALCETSEIRHGEVVRAV